MGQWFLMSDVTAVSFYRGHTSRRLKKNTTLRRGQGFEPRRDTFCVGDLVTEHAGEEKEAAATVVTQASASGGSGCTGGRAALLFLV